MGRLLAATVAAVVLLAVSALPAAAIINGQPDGDDHPYVGLLFFDVVDDDGVMRGRVCSGSLVSPTVVLTAWHCTEGAVAARLWVDEVVAGNPDFPWGGETSTDGTPVSYPGVCTFCDGFGLHDQLLRDIGVVVLEEPVEVERYAQLPALGVVDALRNKAPVEIVGYGASERLRGGGPPVWSGGLTRMQAVGAKMSSNHRNSDELLRLSTDSAHGKGITCVGDSGGPALQFGTDIVIGVTSYGPNGECQGPGIMSRTDIAPVLDWIQGHLEEPDES